MRGNFSIFLLIIFAVAYCIVGSAAAEEATANRNLRVDLDRVLASDNEKLLDKESKVSITKKKSAMELEDDEERGGLSYLSKLNIFSKNKLGKVKSLAAKDPEFSKIVTRVSKDPTKLTEKQVKSLKVFAVKNPEKAKNLVAKILAGVTLGGIFFGALIAIIFKTELSK